MTAEQRSEKKRKQIPDWKTKALKQVLEKNKKKPMVLSEARSTLLYSNMNI